MRFAGLPHIFGKIIYKPERRCAQISGKCQDSNDINTNAHNLTCGLFSENRCEKDKYKFFKLCHDVTLRLFLSIIRRNSGIVTWGFQINVISLADQLKLLCLFTIRKKFVGIQYMRIVI